MSPRSGANSFPPPVPRTLGFQGTTARAPRVTTGSGPMLIPVAGQPASASPIPHRQSEGAPDEHAGARANLTVHLDLGPESVSRSPTAPSPRAPNGHRGRFGP